MSTIETDSTASRSLTLRVEGMTCAGCAASVQRALEQRPGVSGAAVDVTSGRTTVTGTAIEAADVIQAIEGRGFTATVLEEDVDPVAERTEIERRQTEAEHQWRFRAIVGIGLWVPMELLHWLGAWVGVSMSVIMWVSVVGSTIVLGVAGAGFYRSAWASLRRRTTNMDVLIAMGATTAYVYSAVILIGTLAGNDWTHALYFTEAAALLGIISVGHWLEAKATARAGSAVRDLLELQPNEADLVVSALEVRTIPTTAIRAGDRLLIRPGARVPVDGDVVEGESDFDESIVTGESMPVMRMTGDPVIAGAVNTTGRVVIEASTNGRETTIARIARLVSQAQSSKANIQRLADRVCAVFVPSVLTIAALTVLGWWIAGDPGRGIVAAVTVLIISCPCALGLATPMAVMVGTGAASRRGILFKSAGALEACGSIDRVVFDKTGTLTTGTPYLSTVELGDGDMTEAEVLRLAASVEAASEHPVARAIVRGAYARDLELMPVGGFRAIPGEGVVGTVNGRSVRISRHESASCQVEVDGTLVGILGVTDMVRVDAAYAMESLREFDVDVAMLSGDRDEVAQAIGAQLNLFPHEIIAEATPASKMEAIESSAVPTMMVGDGINDAAALAQADVGVAMASGTTIAIESADVVIPGDRVMAVPESIWIARHSLRTIRQNLFFAFIYNGLAIPLAAFGMLGEHGPLYAACAMAMSDMTVIGNALVLRSRLMALSETEPGDMDTDVE